MIIYKALNKINGKIYIGKTVQSLKARIGAHLRVRSHFSNALKKYGLPSFELSVIDSAETKEILNEKEKYWIKFFSSNGPKGYNQTEGGTGGPIRIGMHHSEETRQKMSSTWNGKGDQNPSKRPEVRKKHSNLMKSKWKDPIYVKKRGESLNLTMTTPGVRERVTEASVRPEILIKRSKAMMKVWKRPGYREMCGKLISEGKRKKREDSNF